MNKPSFLQRLASYFYPIKMIKGSGTGENVPELFLYRNRWQLATNTAIYSDSERYRPLIIGFGKSRKRLQKVKDVLVLGAGLGSAQFVLEKMNIQAGYVWVDINQDTLQWAKEILESTYGRTGTFICEDALLYMRHVRQQFDVVVIDIFCGRVVPSFASSPDFLQKCKASLKERGLIVMNYMVNNPEEWTSLQHHFSVIFPGYKVYELGINRILVS